MTTQQQARHPNDDSTDLPRVDLAGERRDIPHQDGDTPAVNPALQPQRGEA